MAAKGDEEGAAPKVVGLALSGSKSSAHVLRWALGNFANDDAPPAVFKLIHVLTPVLAVPTPMGHPLPIDEVSTSVAEGELEKMWIEKQEMLQRCKDTCDENKVEAQVLLVEGKDVADTISSLVSQYQIHSLVVGNPPSKSPFTRRSSASRTTCKICKSLPSFCTAYVVSKDGLSSVHVPESESGSPSGSPVPKGNSESSSTEESTDGTPSRSVYADKDRRIASRTGAESSILSQLRRSDKVPTSSPQELMLSDKIGSIGDADEQDADSAEENETPEEETDNVHNEETENADNEDHPRRAIVGPVPWIGDDNLNWGAAMLRVTPQQAAQLAEAKLIKELLEAGAVSREETTRYADVPAWVRHRPQPEIDAYQVLFARFDEATMTRLRMVQLQRKGMGRHANYSAMDKELKELRELISEAQDELKILCGRIAFKTPVYLLQDPQGQKNKKYPKDPRAQKSKK